MLSFRLTKYPSLWVVLLLWSFSLSIMAESSCNHGCPLALASYYMWPTASVSFVAQLLNTNNEILNYNPSIPDIDAVQAYIRINIPFSCDCLYNGQFLGHIFWYSTQESDDTYEKIATIYYANLTTVDLLKKYNNFDGNNIHLNSVVNVPVNCSCGDAGIDENYGLFLTYPIRPGDNLSSVARSTNSTPSLIQRYNPGVNFSAGTGIVFIPAKDKDGLYHALALSSGHSTKVIAGISVGVSGVVVILLSILCLVRLRRKKNNNLHLDKQKGHSALSGNRHTYKTTVRTLYAGKVGVTIDKSIEFSYEELAEATNNFSMTNMIGSGGFGIVYFAELRSEKVAIKKMDMKATREFLAELEVLTRVHHLNLVCLIGYCVEDCLFLVYEFIDNGNLSQHLRGSGEAPLLWSTRVQIALDTARGLQYIHEQTEHVYIHRDIKSANILIDKDFHAKVADFGLAKLTEVGKFSAATRLVGTFGYMPPEYAHHGVVSPKVDGYAFGVVLYELISAKEAVVKLNAADPDPKGLVGMFQIVLNDDNQNEIRNLVDPRLGDEYPLDSVYKMAKLANACTQESPHLRPSMNAVVVALLALCSTTSEWDSGLFCKTQHVEL